MQPYFEQMLEALRDLIKIDSVEQKPVSDAPFGLGVKKALEYTLNLAKSMGFECVNYDNYVGEIVWRANNQHSNFDDNKNALAILCHLDVVPIGDKNDWSFPPFSATIKNDCIFGRGAIDDKGPLIATLFALKELKDSGFLPKRTIKFILGCDEESGWECIKHYKKVATLPDSGFSPDASFPVLYAEKGIFQIEFNFAYDNSKLKEISGGVAPNVVCDKAFMVGEINENLIKKHNLTLNSNAIESRGKTAHASTPMDGKNAIVPLLRYLADIKAIDRSIVEYLDNDCFNLRSYQDETGNLTFSPDMIRVDGQRLFITVDIRYPSTIDFDEIIKKLQIIAPYAVLSHQKPLFNDPNSELIQSLLKVYNKHANQSSKPIAIGGGTYARALKLGAGFGPEDSDEPYLAHQPNESISFKKLNFLCDVYKDAIKELCSK